ncbi:molybdenum cofactor guanylyltransferase [Pigmentiphaga aceris]|uniref:Molybdenum cofactor guanylyltransferase n=1 Tax=Pigmentiphaga aceris TaxID=1940612 RepID=A0A5C0B3W8_9BURK|nr:molybdenum cofactor guanylyltransferase [Pigmentiphaga aceris]
MPTHDIAGLILAGGQGSRMGGVDKGLQDLHGRPLVAHVHERLAAQVATVLISANRHHDQYRAWSSQVLPDNIADYPGPLAGIEAALTALASQAPALPWLATVPCDAPCLPANLIERLATAAANQQCHVAIAHHGDRVHPVFALIHIDSLPALRAYIATGRRRADGWYADLPHAYADFSDGKDAFINVNTHEELAALSSAQK